MVKHRYALGVALSLLVGVFYGLATPFSKMLVASGVSAVTVVLFRTVFPLFFWGAVLFFRGGLASFRIERTSLLCFCLLGVFAYVMKATCLVMSYRFLNVQFAIMFSYLSPICTIFINAIMNREKPRVLQIFASLLLIFALAFASRGFSAAEGVTVAGLLLASVSVAGSSLGSAYSSLVVRKRKPDIVQQIFYSHACAAVFLFAIKSSLGFGDLAVIGRREIFCLVMVAITTSVLAIYCFFKAVQLVSSSTLQILSSTELLFTLLFVPLIAGIEPSFRLKLGSTLVFIAIFLATLGGRCEEKLDRLSPKN